MSHIRPPAVAGRFYPARVTELQHQLDAFILKTAVTPAEMTLSI